MGERSAVVIGGHPDASNEVAPHGFRAAEAAARGDGDDGVVGLLELTARGLGAHPLDVGRGRLAHLIGEQPGEMPGTGLIAARRASSVTECPAPGSASMASCTSRIGSRRARGIHTGAANWVCPPGRRR